MKVEWVEVGTTGVRDAFVLAKLLKEGKSPGPDGTLQGWHRDPYDPEGNYPYLPNQADDSKYDAEFPMHALSRVRQELEHIKETIRFDDELMESAPFDAQSEPTPKAEHPIDAPPE
jgi:hypothetical protein